MKKIKLADGLKVPVVVVKAARKAEAEAKRKRAEHMDRVSAKLRHKGRLLAASKWGGEVPKRKPRR